MSSGSNNIVITISDGISPTIEPKIRGIEKAAIDANTSIVGLTASLSGMNVANLNVLSTSLNRIPGAANAATAGSNRVTNAFAQLIGRAVGAEAGLGMMGGALGRVGIAAGVAGPLIIAGLAVGAVAGAVLIYEKFEEAARKLVETQIKLNEQLRKDSDTLLEQKETLAGLTGGPLARYTQMLADLNQKSISVNIGAITEELERQKSTWANVVAYAERYLTIVGQTQEGSGVQDISKPVAEQFSLQEADDFIHAQERKRTASKDTKAGLEQDLADVGQELIRLNNLEKNLSDRALDNTEVSRKSIQRYYDQLNRDYQESLGKKQIITAEYNNAAADEQLRQFNEEITRYKEQNERFTIQDELQKRKQQRAGDLSGRDVTGLPLAAKAPLSFDQNKVGKALDRDIGRDTQAVLKQNEALSETVQQYLNAQKAAAAYTIEEKIEAEQTKEATNLQKRFAGNEGLGAAIDTVRAAAEQRIRESDIIKEQISLYRQFDEPLIRYNAAEEAINRSLEKHEITQEQAVVADRKATRARQEALDPLFTYNESLQDTVKLLGEYGDALDVASQVQQIENKLRADGYELDKTDKAALTAYLSALQQQLNIQADINKLVAENSDLTKRNTEHQIALNTAFHNHIISSQQYKIATAQLNIAEAQHNLIVGKGATIQQQLVAGFGKTIQGYEGLAKGISDSYGQVFQTIEEGAAQSIGRALVYSEDLGAAMLDVARTALSELISGFIRLGLQWAINEVISKTLQSTATATSVASAAVLGAAWAPVAAYVSLATFGANAAPAAAAIAGTVALSEALNLASSAISQSGGGIASRGGFATGGYVGNGPGGIDNVKAWLTRGEFVVNAGATQRNRSALEAINSGASAVRANNGGGSPTHIAINVTHDGSTGVYVQQVSKDEIRIIAKQEAQKAVTTHGPSVIASDLQNANSKTSKAVAHHLQAPRKR